MNDVDGGNPDNIYVPLAANQNVTGRDFEDAQPALVIDKDTLTPIVAPGGLVTYTIVVTNTGLFTATGVSISDTLPVSFTYASTDSTSALNATRVFTSTPVAGATTPTWGVWDIRPGGAVRITFIVAVAAGAAQATYDNTAYATAFNHPTVDDDGLVGQDANTPPGQDPEADEDVTVASGAPILVIDKDTTTPTVLAGGQVTYTIVVSNTGGAAALGVTISDTLPANFAYASTVNAVLVNATRTGLLNPAPNATTPTWGAWTINPGGAVWLTFIVNVAGATPAGTYDNTAYATASNHPTVDDVGTLAQDANTPPGQDPEPDEDVTITPLQSLLRLTKTLVEPVSGVATVSDTVTYTLRVTNAGATAITSLTISDIYDASKLRLTSYSQPPTATGTGIVTWTLTSPSFPALAPGASHVITVDFHAEAPTTPADTLNVATVVGVDEFGRPVGPASGQAPVVIVPPGPAMRVVKTLVSPPLGTATVSDTITYTIRVDNVGPTVIESLSLVDSYDPTVLRLTSFSVTPDAQVPGLINWLGSAISGSLASYLPLASGASFTLTVDFHAEAPTAPDKTTNKVTANGTDQYGTPVGPMQSSADVTIVPPLPGLKVTKLLAEPPSGVAVVSNTITFTIRVENTGATDITSLSLVDTYDPSRLTLTSYSVAPNTAGAGTILWASYLAPFLPLRPGQAFTITVDFHADAPTVNDPGGVTVNRVVAEGKDVFGQPLGPAVSQAEVQIQPPAPGLRILKTLVEPVGGVAVVSDTITFTIRVENTGGTLIPIWEVSDTYEVSCMTMTSANPIPPAPPGPPWAPPVRWAAPPLPPLAPGAVFTITVDFHADAPSSGCVNTAAVIGTDVFGQSVGPTSDQAEVQIIPPGAGLAVSKALAAPINGLAAVSDTITFTIRVENVGSTPITSLTITDTYDSSMLTLTSFSVPPDSAAPGDIRWSNNLAPFLPLPPGAAFTITVDFHADAPSIPGVTSNEVEASGVDQFGQPVGPDFGQADVMIAPPPPDLLVVKTLVSPPAGPATVSDTITFTIRVENTGLVTITNLVVVDTYDPTLLRLTSWSVTPDNLGAGTVAWSNQLAPFLPLGPGEAFTITVDFLAEAPGTTTNAATASGVDEYGRPVGPSGDREDVTIVPPPPGLAIVKALAEPPSGIAVVSDTVTFTIRVQNTGATPIASLIVVDTYDPNVLRLTSFSAAPDAQAAGIIEWRGSSAPVGGSLAPYLPLLPGQAFTITVDFHAEAATAPFVTTNVATVNGVDMFGQPIGPTRDDAVVTVQGPPALVIDKDTSTPSVLAGGQVTYTIVVSNTGGSTATGVTISDTLPSGFTYASASSIVTSGLVTRAATVDPTAGAGTPVWGTWTVEAGGAVRITFIVDVAASVGSGTYDNTAYAAASNHRLVDDAGPVGQDADTPPGQDPEPDEDVTVQAQTPVIGLAKNTDAVYNNGDGTYAITFTLTVSNYGNVPLNSVVITDDIVSQFAGLNPTGFAATNGTLNANAAWNGTAGSNILAAGQSLAVGAWGTVRVRFTITPGSTTAINNTAWAGGTSPAGVTVTDRSTDGLNPDPDNDGPADNLDPTPVLITETPRIGAAKDVAYVINHGDGTYTAAYTITVKNMGDIVLHSVQVTDDLSITFTGAVSYTATSWNSAEFTENPSYNGSSNLNLLTGADSLAPGATGTILLVVRLNPGSNPGPYFNSAYVYGTSPAGTRAWDWSDPGINPDPNGNGQPNEQGENDPTQIVFAGEADVSILKSELADPIVSGQLLAYTLIVRNAGPAVALNVVVTDTLPSGVTFVMANPARSNVGPNPLVWNLGTMTANSSVSILILAQADLGTNGVITNTAVVTTTTQDSNPANNTALEPTTVVILTGMRLISFTATDLPGGPGVRVRWAIQTEYSVSGFMIHRAADPTGPYKQITPVLIPSKGIGTYEYEYIDVAAGAGNTWWYQLQVLDDNVWFGPTPNRTALDKRLFLPAIMKQRTLVLEGHKLSNSS